MTKTVAYLRVSTSDQDLQKKRLDILDFANTRDFGKVHFVEEIVTGKKSWKERKIKSVIDDLKKGDRLIIPELSRLGRSMLEIMEILAVSKEKGINIFAVKGCWELNGTLQSKIVGMVFAMAAEIERDLISSRTKEALKARKAAGVQLGRPRGPGKSKLDRHKPEIIAGRYNTSLANLYNWLRRHNIESCSDTVCS
jgi:DNA invertase Pin-like site-specific DNA recombinase